MAFYARLTLLSAIALFCLIPQAFSYSPAGYSFRVSPSVGGGYAYSNFYVTSQASGSFRWRQAWYTNSTGNWNSVTLEAGVERLLVNWFTNSAESPRVELEINQSGTWVPVGTIQGNNTLNAPDPAQANKTLTLQQSTGGNITQSGNGTYTHNATATVTANPSPGYLWLGWTGDATSSSNPLSLQMSINRTIGAIWTAGNSTAETKEGTIGEILPDGYSATIKVKFSDGETRLVDVDPETGNYSIPFQNSDAGRSYELELVIWQLPESVETGEASVVNSWSYGNGTVATPSATPRPPSPAPSPSSTPNLVTVGNTVSPSGSVRPVVQSTGNLGTSVSTIGNQGQPVTAYRGSATGTGIGGFFVPQGNSTSEIDLTDIKNLLREGNLDQKELLAAVRSLKATPTPSPSPTASPSPSPTPESDDTLPVDKNQGEFDPQGINGAEVVDFDAPAASPVSWVVTFPGGTVVDLNPFNIPVFAGFASWLKTIIWWLLTIWITQHCYKRIMLLMTQLEATATSSDISRIATNASSRKSLVQTVFGYVPFYGTLKTVVMALFFRAALITAVLVFAGLVGGQFFTLSGITNWMLGGGNLVQSLANAILAGNASVQGSVWALSQFVPLDHVIVCLSIWAACEAVAIGIHSLYSAYVRFI